MLDPRSLLVGAQTECIIDGLRRRENVNTILRLLAELNFSKRWKNSGGWRRSRRQRPSVPGLRSGAPLLSVLATQAAFLILRSDKSRLSCGVAALHHSHSRTQKASEPLHWHRFVATTDFHSIDGNGIGPDRSAVIVAQSRAPTIRVRGRSIAECQRSGRRRYSGIGTLPSQPTAPAQRLDFRQALKSPVDPRRRIVLG